MSAHEAKQYFISQLKLIEMGRAQWLAPYAKQAVIEQLTLWQKLHVVPAEWRYDASDGCRQYLWGLGSKGNDLYMCTFIVSPTEEWGIVDFSFTKKTNADTTDFVTYARK